MNNIYRMSKRRRQAILFFTYGFMTLATIVISAICLLLILGYRFDLVDRQLEQGGLVQFRSVPSGATITFDNKILGFRTPGKIDVAVGRHTTSLQRTGYHPWSKTITLAAGELVWLNSARLIPQNIKTTPVVNFTTRISQALQTPSREFVAAIGEASQPKIHIIDLRNPADPQERTVAIPQAELTIIPDAASTFRIAEWDFGSRFVLVAHDTGGKTEYIRVDRSAEDGAPRNITKEFNLPFKNMHFSGTSGNLLYAMTDTDIRKIDIGNGSVSQPLVTGVESYRLYRENDIAFTALRADQRLAGVYINNKESIVRSASPAQAMTVDVGQYYSQYYLAVSAPGGIDIIKNPAEANEMTGKVAARLPISTHGIDWVDMSHSGRFVVAGDATAYSTYDLEKNTVFTTIFATGATRDTSVTWLDDFYLVSTVGDEAKIIEYDGSNPHTIAALTGNLPAFLSDDGTFLYSFTTRDDHTSLQSSRLILE